MRRSPSSRVARVVGRRHAGQGPAPCVERAGSHGSTKPSARLDAHAGSPGTARRRPRADDVAQVDSAVREVERRPVRRQASAQSTDAADRAPSRPSRFAPGWTSRCDQDGLGRSGERDLRPAAIASVPDRRRRCHQPGRRQVAALVVAAVRPPGQSRPGRPRGSRRASRRDRPGCRACRARVTAGSHRREPAPVARSSTRAAADAGTPAVARAPSAPRPRAAMRVGLVARGNELLPYQRTTRPIDREHRHRCDAVPSRRIVDGATPGRRARRMDLGRRHRHPRAPGPSRRRPRTQARADHVGVRAEDEAAREVARARRRRLPGERRRRTTGRRR